MSESILRDKSKDFAKMIVILCREIKTVHRESVLTNQLLRSGTLFSIQLKQCMMKQ